MENDSPSITTAKPPFDDVNADIVLRTSDHVDFRIFRIILALSSPFFQGMFTLPQPPDPSHVNDGNAIRRNNGSTNPPIIDVSEDSHTLDTLLRFLYPNTRIDPFESPAHARKVAIAASKYNISAALDRVADKVQAQYVASRPLEVYFLAWQMGWEDVAKAAARNCLSDPGLVNSDDDALVRDGMLNYPEAGIAYYRLETYRNMCRQELQDALDELDLHPYHDSVSCDSHCSNKDSYAGVSSQCVRCWASQYLGNVKKAVLERPRRDTLGRDDLIPSPTCSRCEIEYVTSIAEFPQRVAEAIEDALSAVRQVIHDKRM